MVPVVAPPLAESNESIRNFSLNVVESVWIVYSFVVFVKTDRFYLIRCFRFYSRSAFAEWRWYTRKKALDISIQSIDIIYPNHWIKLHGTIFPDCKYVELDLDIAPKKHRIWLKKFYALFN